MRYAALVLLLMGCKESCENVACGVAAPSVHLHVIDAVTQQPVVGVSILQNGETLTYDCVPTDGAAGCDSYDLFLIGEHTLTVQAPAYQPATIHFDTGVTGDCCMGPAHVVSMTVPLNH